MIQDTGKKLTLAFQKHIDKVYYFCNAENISPNIAVHEIRKSFKRMRAFLIFYAKSSDSFSRDIKSEIKELGKSLSLARESAVNIQVFSRISEGNDLITEKRIKTIKGELIHKNTELTKNEFSKKEVCLEIQKTMKTIVSYLEHDHTELIPVPDICQVVCKSYYKGFNSFTKIINEHDSEELHNLRKKLKVLWYQLELFRYLQPRYLKIKSDQLHKITEQLGEDHDLYVFLNEIKTGNYKFDAGEIKIIENQVQHLKEINELRLSSRLKQFFVDEPEVFNTKMAQVFEL